MQSALFVCVFFLRKIRAKKDTHKQCKVHCLCVCVCFLLVKDTKVEARTLLNDSIWAPRLTILVSRSVDVLSKQAYVRASGDGHTPQDNILGRAT